MTEAEGDARIAEVVSGIVRLRRILDGQSFVDLLGSILVEIGTADEILVERAHRRPPATAGNVVPFQSSHRADRSEDER